MTVDKLIVYDGDVDVGALKRELSEIYEESGGSYQVDREVLRQFLISAPKGKFKTIIFTNSYRALEDIETLKELCIEARIVFIGSNSSEINKKDVIFVENIAQLQPLKTG